MTRTQTDWLWGKTRGAISCVICAYNEADRIDAVLRIVAGHPLIDEIIVVDDGSTDDTRAAVQAYPNVTLISVWPNGGKTQALMRGVAEARCDSVMLLDADLDGLTADAVARLAAPVLSGAADGSISLRGDSLGVYRALGIDFVSGERVLPRDLLMEASREMAELPRWGCEVFINQLLIEKNLRLAVVDWSDVSHTPKHRKVGAWRGVMEDLRMVGDTVRVLTPAGVLRQHVELMRLLRLA